MGDVVNGKVLEGNVTSDGVVSAEVMTTLVRATVSDGDGSGRAVAADQADREQ